MFGTAHRGVVLWHRDSLRLGRTRKRFVKFDIINDEDGRVLIGR